MPSRAFGILGMFASLPAPAPAVQAEGGTRRPGVSASMNVPGASQTPRRSLRRATQNLVVADIGRACRLQCPEARMRQDVLLPSCGGLRTVSTPGVLA